MKYVSILVPENAVIEAIADPFYMFEVVNQVLESSGKPPFFKLQLVGLSKEVKLNCGLFSVRTDFLLKDVKRSDLIIAPSLNGDIKKALELNKGLVPWIIEQYRNGAELASLCVGSFLLASTGLLDGKKCSTHWNAINEFRVMFPNVKVEDGNIITEEDNIYSSGGANSYWNLLVYLVEKYIDRKTAILAAKLFAIDINREGQSQFMVFQGQKQHTDNVIKQAQEFIEMNFQNKITVGELADKFAIGRRSFERRFKKATNNTTVEYMHRVKMEAAKRSFETSRKSITEVMFDIGYSDPKAFRNTFRRIAGLTPIEYRNKYNKEAAGLMNK